MGASAMVPEARPENVLPIGWLRPHFIDEQGNLISSIYSLLVTSQGKRIVIDTCLGNDKPRIVPMWNKRQGRFLETSRRRRLSPRVRRLRRLHAPAPGPRRLEHHAGRRPLGADLSQRALHLLGARLGMARQGAGHARSATTRATPCGRSSRPASPTWWPGLPLHGRSLARVDARALPGTRQRAHRLPGRARRRHRRPDPPPLPARASPLVEPLRLQPRTRRSTPATPSSSATPTRPCW